MKKDLEDTRAKIDQLFALIQKTKDEDEEIWEGYEIEIARLIIDYSIRNNIIIPLIDYELYKEHFRDDNDEDQYDFWEPFNDAMLEENLKNPRFTLYPEIKYLASCWKV
ncbi:MAG: hypothetical protein JXB49_17385 [Bacteroidales bacterium]|nr:hypothetical protein [Bacteroidales bacterium]MBN2862181.1 hypothetical protein [Bacteroidales bacterium]